MTTRKGTPPTYTTVWWWLISLLAAGILVAFLPLPQVVTIFLVFAAAAVKAGLVAFNYMHLRYERILIYALAITPVVLLLTLTAVLLPDIAFGR